MIKPDLELPDCNDSSAVETFLAQAPQYDKLWCSKRSQLDGSIFVGRSFPNVRELSYLGCKSVVNADDFFSALPALTIASFWTLPANEECDATALAALSAATCWQSLQSLELHVSYRGAAFESLKCWGTCWNGKTMSLKELSLSGLSLEAIRSIWRAEFPSLMKLKSSPALTDALLLQLLESASLPQLEQLDIRFNGITGKGLQQFGQQAKERFPKLREIGIEFFTGEKEEDYDWNGAVVQSFDVQYSPEEITEMYLKDTGIVAKRL